ncbi:hypothetical protein WK78_26410 [Burkholderia cepacia]|nr:hypothetical protein WK78_26410 [Burkholderia cepacia]
MSEQEVIEEAKSAILEYYGNQELYDEGYLFPTNKFDDEDQEKLDMCEADEIDLDKFDWDEGELLSYVVESNSNHCRVEFGYVYVDGKDIYFDREKTSDDSIAEIVEERAKAIFLKQSLDANLSTNEHEAKKVIKI